MEMIEGGHSPDTGRGCGKPVKWDEMKPVAGPAIAKRTFIAVTDEMSISAGPATDQMFGIGSSRSVHPETRAQGWLCVTVGHWYLHFWSRHRSIGLAVTMCALLWKALQSHFLSRYCHIGLAASMVALLWKASCTSATGIVPSGLQPPRSLFFGRLRRRIASCLRLPCSLFFGSLRKRSHPACTTCPSVGSIASIDP